MSPVDVSATPVLPAITHFPRNPPEIVHVHKPVHSHIASRSIRPPHLTLALLQAVQYWFSPSGDAGRENTTPRRTDVPVNSNLVYSIGFVYNFNVAGFDVASAVAR